MNRTSSFLAASAVVLMTQVAPAATYVYDLETEIGATNGTLMSTDGWTGSDIGNWVVQDQNGLKYARNQNDGDNAITRQNDAGFNYTIPSGTTNLTIEIEARTGSGFWQAGLANSSGALLLGIGSDFGGNNKYFIFEGSRFNESGTSATGDGIHTLRMEVDLLANSGNGSADLFYDNTLIIDDQALTLPDMTTASGLYIRDNTRFVGPGKFTIVTVPEPSSAALLGLAGIALISRRRR